MLNDKLTAPAVEVGDNVRVNWSNGAGYSVYTVVDDEGAGPHRLELVGEWEISGGGLYVRVT